MRNDISTKLINYAKGNESIESIFHIVDENYDSFTKIYTVVNEVIIAKLEEELVALFDDVILMTRTKNDYEIDKSKHSYTSINLYTKDNTKITESIIASDYVEDFIKTLPKGIEFIYNKPGTSRIDTNIDFIFHKPSEYELISTVRDFFGSAFEVSLYINEKDEVAACIKMEEVRSSLLKMIDYYVKDKYAYTMDIGDDGQRMKNTLEIDIRENYLLTYHHEDLIDIYNSLFKACVLFRKIAMGLCEKYGYPYPREIDVETLKVLRKNYKTLESFLN